MKKFLVAVVLVGMLGACTSAPTGGGDGAEDQEITIWHLVEDGEWVDAAIERFEADNPDITVTATGIENDPYKTKVRVALGTEEAPDIFHTWGGGWLQAFVEEGLVEDLTPYLNEGGWRDSLAPGPLELATYDGKVYGLPLALSSVFMWYRTDIFEEHGLTPPETYPELLDVIETLQADGIAPITLANKTKWPGAFYLIYLATRIGGPEAFLDAFNREGDASFADPAFVEAGETIQELVDAGAFPEGFNGLNEDTGESRQLLYSGDAAMSLMGSWLWQAVKDEAPELADKIDFFPFPTIPGGEGNADTLVGGASPVFAVTAAGNVDPSVEFLKYLSDAQTAQHIADLGVGVPVAEGASLDDPMLQKIADFTRASSYVQLYYDQFLPPELAELHKDTTQALFGETMTPEEAAQEMETEAAKALE